MAKSDFDAGEHFCMARKNLLLQTKSRRCLPVFSKKEERRRSVPGRMAVEVSDACTDPAPEDWMRRQTDDTAYLDHDTNSFFTV